MATSAFKSTSRRGNGSEKSPDKKAPIRRSHSVSALSRGRHHLSQSDVTSDFTNKRDNPLFWTTSSPPNQEVETSAVERTFSVDGQSERGRSVTRNTGFVNKKVVSDGKKDAPRQSLSTVDTGRRRHRSFSRDHYAASETRNCEGRISAGSLWESEEKTIKAVCEQMKSIQGDNLGGGDATSNGIYETVRSEVRRAIIDIQNDLGSVIQRNNATSIACTNVPPDLINPGTVEIVLDIRREYTRKFEESQERASKLRADLVEEEHRGQELSRILKEILPDPKKNCVQKSPPGRKNSSERKKMSKCLTEEAMTYFDECVSISTFDSSDFSAPEDSLLNPTPVCGGIASLAQGSPSISISRCLDHNQESGGRSQSHTDSSLTATSGTDVPVMNQSSLRSGNNAESSWKSKFSFSRKPTENSGLQEDIRNYIKNTEKECDNGGINSQNSKSNCYDTHELFRGHTEGLLFDRVLLKDQIESGSLHLCGGGLAIWFSPFGSIS